MRVAALQMVSGSDVSANLRAAGDLLAQAASAGAELAILPEYFCLIGRADADKLAIFGAFNLKLHRAAHLGKQGIVPTATDVNTGVKFSTALTNNNITDQYLFTTETLDAQALGL